MHPNLRVDVACGAGLGPEYPIGDGTGTEHVVSTTVVHDVRTTPSFHCGNAICPTPMLCLEALQTKRISLRAGGYGSERHDPQRGRGVFAAGERSMAGGWPAGRFCQVGSDRKSGAIIASMPTSVWPLEVATTIATPLIALLPTQAGNLGQSPLASAYGTKAGRIIRIGLVLAAVAFAVAFQTGVFTTFDAPEPDGTSVASFAVAPRSLPGLIVTVRCGSITAGDSPTACRWRSEDVASARDACRFLGLAFQSCSAARRATLRQPCISKNR